MQDDLDALRDLWTSPVGRFQLLGSTDPEDRGLLPFDTRDQQAVLIEDDALNERVIALMLAAGVPVVRIPPPCLINDCRQGPLRDGLCLQHLQEYEAAQEQRQRHGLTKLKPRAWADAQLAAERRRRARGQR
jgi:hypothetical protein